MKPAIDVEVREVGMRDGLQIIPDFFPTELKKEWIIKEANSGVPEIEVCSFVPPKVSGQFVDCEDIIPVALNNNNLTVAALVPNLKGAENGFKNKVHKLNFVLSVSESHNQANVRCSRETSLDRFRQIAALRNSSRDNKKMILGSGLSTALGCTIEGKVDTKDVLWIAEELVKAGADELAIADTVGYANPAQVREIFKLVRENFGEDVTLAAHFHDTRGLGLANVTAALEEGVRKFDASLAGLGGCPFAPNATGNIVMDDLVFMLESMGLRTGVNIETLLEVREIVQRGLPNEPLYGALARAGLPKGFVAEEQSIPTGE